MPDSEIGAVAGTGGSGGYIITATVQANIDDVKAKLEAAEGWLGRLKIKWGLFKKEYVVWSRTITRNITLILTLMGETALVQTAQQALQIWTLGVTINQLRIRAQKAFTLGMAGMPLEFVKSALFASQGILLGFVQQQAMIGRARAETLARNIARVRMWADNL